MNYYLPAPNIRTRIREYYTPYRQVMPIYIVVLKVSKNLNGTEMVGGGV